ncbi:MAG: aminoacyl-tRNA hydrolase [Candidatus Niyogibacteria bacterium]|nr:aminoacyl-tRNA hydrolase [Candidatus Niyogibacteria bacterium]
MKIVLGLGNPRAEYEKTRHNAGALALQYAARKFKFSDWESAKKYESLASEGKIGDEKFLFLLPQTFMNNSGKAARGLNPKNLSVIHDDIDLPLGSMKISFGRGSGGHNGVESIIRAVKTREFARIRIGVAPKKKPEHKKMPDFLTSQFRADELRKLAPVFKKIAASLECIAQEGPERAMNRFN